MVKLIVCDLDGTLLARGEKELSSEVLSAIQTCLARGIHFCVASGRSYHELKRLFRTVEDEIYFIASDGALLVHKEETLSEAAIPKRLLSKAAMLSKRNELPGILFTGKYLSYYSCSCPKFASYTENNLHHHAKRMGELEEIEGSVYKLSFYKKEAIAPRELSELCEIYDGSVWQDFIVKDAGKKVTLQKLLSLLALSPEETVVFGDNDNDSGMLSLVPNSYAVGEASEAAKKASHHYTNNLVKTMNELILN